MQEIIRGLYLGSDDDVPKAKERGWARLCCCKDGPDSHRSMLEYEGRSAITSPLRRNGACLRRYFHVSFNGSAHVVIGAAL